MSMNFIRKPIPVGQPILENALIFLVKAYLKPVLETRKIMSWKNLDRFTQKYE